MTYYPTTYARLFYPRYQDVAAATLLANTSFQEAAGESTAPAMLLASADPDVLRVYPHLFRSIWPDCRLLLASNAASTVKLMRSEQLALMLLDLEKLEGGDKLLQTMRADEQPEHLPVIALVGERLLHSARALIADGVAAIASKGFYTVTETATQMKQAFSGARPLRGATRYAVYEVIAQIHAHYAEPLTRDTLATVASVSPRHLTRCFVAEVGLSPMAYLNRYRIYQALQLLQQGGTSIREISQAVGFSNNAYFDVVFRREIGLAPSGYRHCFQFASDPSSMVLS